MLRKLTHVGAWLADYYRLNGVAPSEGAIQSTLIKCHIANYNQSSPGIHLKLEAMAVIPAYSDPDTCHA